MPYASPLLRSLRQETGIKPGRWADTVEYDRTQYTHVEAGRRSASPEFFARCAAQLTNHLGTKVEPRLLMKGGGRDLPRPRNSTARGTTPEAAETAETTEAEATAEARERGVA